MLERLEERTLLSYGAAAAALGTELHHLQKSIDDALSTAIPVVGSQLGDFLPAQTLVDQFDAQLATALGNATPATLRSDLASALGPLVVGGANGVVVDPPSGLGAFRVFARLHQDVTLAQPAGAPKTADFGLGHFLKVDVTSGLTVTLGFDYLLGFTVSADGSSASLETTNLKQGVGAIAGVPSLPNDSMAISLKAFLPGFSAKGTLTNLLSASATIPQGAIAPSFSGAFGINVLSNGDVNDSITGQAEATLSLALQFSDDPSAKFNPKLVTEFHVLGSYSGGTTPTLDDLSFHNLSLDVGQLFPGFITEVVGDVQKFTKPLQPIVDFVDAEIPGLSSVGVHVSLRSMLKASGNDLGTALDIISFINRLPGNSSGSGMLPLGDFSLKAPSLDSVMNADSNALTDAIQALGPPIDPSSLLTAANGMSGGFFASADTSATADSTGAGFTFPLVTDPKGVAWQLLLGGDPTLFTFKTPTLSAAASGEIGAEFGVFSVMLGGSIDIQVNLSMGYDASGLKELIAPGPKQGRVADLLDGFFVDNTVGPDKDGNLYHHSGVDLNGSIIASAGILGATLSGDITAGGSASLDNKLNDAQGRVHLNDILNQSLSCVFVFAGNINAGLTFSYGFDVPGFGRVDLFSYDLVRKVLLDFSTLCPSDSASQDGAADPTIYIDLQNGDQTIRVYRVDTYTKHDPSQFETQPEPETHEIVVDYGDHKVHYPLGTILFNGDHRAIVQNQDTHHYNLIATRTPLGPLGLHLPLTGDHTIIIDPGVGGGISDPNGNGRPVYDSNGNLQFEPLNAILVGGLGNDHLEYHGIGQSYLVGGGGSNTLIGGQTEYGNYIPRFAFPYGSPFVDPRFANNVPVPGGILAALSLLRQPGGGLGPNGKPLAGVGGNTLIGTPGDDLLVGGPAGNLFIGGAGNDQEYGGIGLNDYSLKSQDDPQGWSAAPHLVIHKLAKNVAKIDKDELDINTVQQFVGLGSTSVNVILGSTPALGLDLIGGSDPSRRLAYVDGVSGATVFAAGISNVSMTGSGTYSVDDLSTTSVKLVRIGLDPVRNPTGPPLPLTVDRVTIVGGPAKNTFGVDSVVDYKTGLEVTNVQLVQSGRGAYVTEIDNLGPTDSLVLKGGAGGNQFTIGMDISVAFAIDVQDVASKAVNQLVVDGGQFRYGSTGSVPAPGGANPGLGGSIGLASQQTGIVYVSRFGVLFQNIFSDLFSNVSSITTSPRVTFDNTITKLNVQAPDVPNQIDVGPLAVANTSVTAGKLGDAFHVVEANGNLTLNGGAGDDSFDVTGVIHGSLTIDGKGGNDVAKIENVARDTGTVYVRDSKGLIALTIDDQTDAKVRNVVITASATTGLGPALIRYEPLELAALNVVGAHGFVPRGVITHVFYNHYEVRGTPGYNNKVERVKTTLTTEGPAGDTVTVGNQGHLGAVDGPLSIVSPYRKTFLTIDGSKDGSASLGHLSRGLGSRAVGTAQGSNPGQGVRSAASSGGTIRPSSIRFVVIDSTQVTGLSFGGIEFGADGLKGLTVVTPRGNNLIRVVGTPNQGPVGSITTSLIGRDSDFISVGDPTGQLQGIQGALHVSNAARTAVLTIDDSGDPAGRQATVGPGLVHSLAPADITYETNGVTSVDLKGGSGGNLFRLVGTIAGSNMAIDGGSGANQLIGRDVANTWRIKSNDAGNVGNVSFQRVGSLTGGALSDFFTPVDGAALSGRIDGGAGSNLLNFTAQNRDVTVNLALGTATGVAGGVVNVANVLGGRRNSVLVGDGHANILGGGVGRNLIIGGGGNDQIIGGVGENILIGGGTAHDLVPQALDALMREFARVDEDFTTRVAHLQSGDGANGSVMLNPTTVGTSNDSNVLTGGHYRTNWFFLKEGRDVIKLGSRHKGDVVTKL